MRAGEAKLRGRVGVVLLSAQGSNGNIDSYSPPAAGWVALAFVAIRVGFKQNLAYWLAICVGFKSPRQHLLLYAWALSKSYRTG